MTDSPDEPQTPRTDAILPLGAGRNPEVQHVAIELAGLARQLELELRGSLRIIDEMGVELRKAQEGRDLQFMRILKAQERCAELEKDAARYRWLVSLGQDNYCIEIYKEDEQYDSNKLVFSATPRLLSDCIDAAIDAAIKP